jgi:hypothetical protein
MGISVGIRSPAEVIALALEDAGIEPSRAKEISEDAAKRLGNCLRRCSDEDAETVICHNKTGVQWATYTPNKAT